MSHNHVYESRLSLTHGRLLCRNYEGDAYPDYAASVLAGNDLFRSIMAAAFPLFAVQMFRNLEKLNGPQAVSPSSEPHMDRR